METQGIRTNMPMGVWLRIPRIGILALLQGGYNTKYLIYGEYIFDIWGNAVFPRRAQEHGHEETPILSQ